jgi:hypothetical protein
MKTSFLLSKKAWVAFVIACSSFMILLASCSKNSDPTPEPVGELDVRAVNTVSGSASQDLLVNNAVKVSAVSYGNASAYVKITSGSSNIGFYNTGTTTTMNAGGQANLPIGAKASIYYLKTGDGTFGAALYDDATTNPTTGKAKVRFLHMNNFLITSSTTSTPIAVAIDGTASPLIPSINFGVASNYFEVDPGAKFNFSATGVIAGAAFDGPIVANKIYTIWVDGASSTNLTGHLVLQN